MHSLLTQPQHAKDTQTGRPILTTLPKMTVLPVLKFQPQSQMLGFQGQPQNHMSALQSMLARASEGREAVWGKQQKVQHLRPRCTQQQLSRRSKEGRKGKQTKLGRSVTRDITGVKLCSTWTPAYRFTLPLAAVSCSVSIHVSCSDSLCPFCPFCFTALTYQMT